jgi:hypothetical protein
LSCLGSNERNPRSRGPPRAERAGASESKGHMETGTKHLRVCGLSRQLVRQSLGGGESLGDRRSAPTAPNSRHPVRPSLAQADPVRRSFSEGGSRFNVPPRVSPAVPTPDTQPPAHIGCSMFDVRCSMFDVPLPPPPRPWTLGTRTSDRGLWTVDLGQSAFPGNLD